MLCALHHHKYRHKRAMATGPFCSPLSQFCSGNFSNFFTFILGSPFLLPQRANNGKGEFSQLQIWMRLRGLSAWGIQLQLRIAGQTCHLSNLCVYLRLCGALFVHGLPIISANKNGGWQKITFVQLALICTRTP